MDVVSLAVYLTGVITPYLAKWFTKYLIPVIITYLTSILFVKTWSWIVGVFKRRVSREEV